MTFLEMRHAHRQNRKIQRWGTADHNSQIHFFEKVYSLCWKEKWKITEFLTGDGERGLGITIWKCSCRSNVKGLLCVGREDIPNYFKLKAFVNNNWWLLNRKTTDRFSLRVIIWWKWLKIQNAAGEQAARSANSEPPVCKSSKDAENQSAMVPFKENEIFVIAHYWLVPVSDTQVQQFEFGFQQPGPELRSKQR